MKVNFLVPFLDIEEVESNKTLATICSFVLINSQSAKPEDKYAAYNLAKAILKGEVELDDEQKELILYILRKDSIPLVYGQIYDLLNSK